MNERSRVELEDCIHDRTLVEARDYPGFRAFFISDMDQSSCDHPHVLRDGTKRERWQETERADNEDYKDQPQNKERPVVRERPFAGGTIFFVTSDPASARVRIMIT